MTRAWVAGAAAQRAAALARRPAETYQAVMLLARLECDAGHHQAECDMRGGWRRCARGSERGGRR